MLTRKQPRRKGCMSDSTWQTVARKRSVLRPDMSIEAHVMPEHLCPIGITSMTPVQMVTGCDHLISPVPIHLPVNSSFDTLCPLSVRGGPHMITTILKAPHVRRDEQETRFPPKVAKHKTTHAAHAAGTFDLFVAGRESQVGPLDIAPLKS